MKDIFYLMIVLAMMPIIVVEWVAFIKIMADGIKEDDK